jgi:hypothetical protein
MSGLIDSSTDLPTTGAAHAPAFRGSSYDTPDVRLATMADEASLVWCSGCWSRQSSAKGAIHSCRRRENSAST